MDKFQNAYQKAAEELPEFRMDAAMAQDELHHYKMRKQGRKYLITRGCTAAAVFLLCGAGTVAAKTFRDSIVKVNENGFTITSTGEPKTEPGKEGIPDPASVLKAGGAFSVEDDFPEEAVYEEYEPEFEEYDSLEAFREQSGAVIAIPDESLLGRDFSEERIDVIDNGREIFILLSDEDMYFSLSQMDNRGYESYSTGTAYMGESRNERNFTNSQGLSYVMFDTVDEAGSLDSVHAVISVNGRDLTLNFQGFEESTIEKTLFALDLTVYFAEEETR